MPPGLRTLRDAERQPRTPLRLAEVWLEVRVELDQSRASRSGSTRRRPCPLACAAAECGATLRIRLPSMTMSTSVRAVVALHVERAARRARPGVPSGRRPCTSDRAAPRASRRSRCRRSSACPSTDRGCASNRPPSWASWPISVVTCRGGPSGSPAGVTGHTASWPS